MPLIPIDSLGDPRLEIFRDVKAIRHSRWSRYFVAEGKRLVKRLLLSDFTVESVLITERRVDEFLPWLRPEINAFVMPQPLAAELVGYNFHSGAMASALRKPSLRLEEVFHQNSARKTFVVCPDVNDPENIGTLIRLGAAFGIDALLLGPACADPFSRRVLRVSMGNVLTLPIIQSRDLQADLLRLKTEWQVQLAATVVDSSDPTDEDDPFVVSSRVSSLATATITQPTEGSTSHAAWERPPIETLPNATRPDRIALLFGNEAFGLGPEWLGLCDRCLTIPMSSADSLNVAVAAGIFLYHFTSIPTTTLQKYPIETANQ